MAQYTSVGWVDGSAGNTPLDAANLGKMDQGIADEDLRNPASPGALAVDGIVATNVGTSGSQTQTAMDGRYPVVDPTTHLLPTTVMSAIETGRIQTDLTTSHTFAFPGGSAGNLRLPINGSAVIDGSTLPAGTSDKVAYSHAATFKGGFSNEASYGGANPGFLFGANFYNVTGTNTGDLAGITDYYGVLTEAHMSTPGASVNKVYGASSQVGMDPTATGATVSEMYGHWVAAPGINAGTVTQVASLRVDAPVVASGASVSGLNVALLVNGPMSLNGPFTGQSAVTATMTPGIYPNLNATTNEPSVIFAKGDHAMSIGYSTDDTLHIDEAGVATRVSISRPGNVLLLNNGANLALGNNPNQGHNGLGVLHLGTAGGGAPSVPPTTGGVFYATSTGIYILGSAGTVTKIASL